MKNKKEPLRPLGPLEKPYNRYPVIMRSRWQTEGTRELSRRIANRLSLSNKDAMNILRVVGQESGDMAYEGWVFSIPFLATFWQTVTSLRKVHLKGYEGQIFGNNKKAKSEQSAILKRRFKEEKLREANAKSEAE
jgi:hypothetical protein